jgi:hypothetical protein
MKSWRNEVWVYGLDSYYSYEHTTEHVGSIKGGQGYVIELLTTSKNKVQA